VVAVAVSAAALYFAFRGIDVRAVGRAIASSDHGTLVPALVATAIGVYVRVVRWQLLFPSATRPPFRPAAETLLLANFFNNILPARTGEVVRVFALHERAGTARAETAATIVVERAFDILALLLLLFVTLPWLPAISWLRAAALLGAVATFVLVGLALVLARYGDRRVVSLLRPLARLPLISEENLERNALSILRGLAALREARLGFASFTLTIVSWLFFAASFWFVAVGFSPGLSPFAGVLVAVGIGLALILPSGPAALGVFEAAGVATLAVFGIPRAEALSAAIVIHALNFFPFLAAGAFVLFAWSRTGTGGLQGMRGRAHRSSEDTDGGVSNPEQRGAPDAPVSPAQRSSSATPSPTPTSRKRA
jgi:glycosyltransferase 2 family protein